MIVGDRVQVTPTAYGVKRKRVVATVIYIHPCRRYYTVAYSAGPYVLRESYHFEHRGGGTIDEKERIGSDEDSLYHESQGRGG